MLLISTLARSTRWRFQVFSEVIHLEQELAGVACLVVRKYAEPGRFRQARHSASQASDDSKQRSPTWLAALIYVDVFNPCRQHVARSESLKAWPCGHGS